MKRLVPVVSVLLFAAVGAGFGSMSGAASFVDEYGTTAKVREEVDGYVLRACFFLSTNKLDEARKNENLAKVDWQSFCVYTEAQAQGRIRAGRARLPTFDEIEREDVSNILSGKMPFPADLLKPLRAALKVAEDAALEKVVITLPLVAPIPPVSPLPK